MKSNHIEDAEDRITKGAIAQSAARIVGPTSILAVVRSGILARTFPVATIGREVSFNQDIKAITPKNGYLLPTFLFWMLKSREAHILRIGVKKGATVHSLSSGFLEALRFPLPPVDEQRRIVGLLDRAAEIRRRAEAARAKARAIIPALFLDTFGDPATNPNGWPIRRIFEVASIGGGKRLAKGAPYSDEATAHRYIRAGDIAPGVVHEEEIRYISEEVWRPIRRYIVAVGDCVITIAGKIGVAAPVTAALDGANLTENAARIRPTTCCWRAEFLATLLNSSFCQNQIAALTGRVTIGKLALERLGRLNILLPPLALQSTFAEQVHRVHALARSLDAAAAKAEAMAAALSAEVFDARAAGGVGKTLAAD